jgi:tetraprenyl-beta-curcumene synthase
MLELRGWRARALRIPASSVRQVALLALDHKQGNTQGAALFSVIPRKRSRPLLRLLTTYQVLWDFLDSLSETWRELAPADTLRLHQALVDAVDPASPVRDYYSQLAVPDDGGYLSSLVEACRACCRALPSFHQVAPVLYREAERIGVQAINHATEPAAIAPALRAWVAREYPGTHEVAWFELAAAAGANIAIYALFALAADALCSCERVADTYRAYFPWAGALATMLDGFVDQLDDACNGEHSYVAYYRSPDDATRQIGRLVRRCLSETHSLEDGERHTLVAAAMVAMYLSRDSARASPLNAATRQVARAGGSLTRALLPVLRLWRLANQARAD